MVGIYIDDDFVKDGMVDTGAMRPIARLGYMDYAVVTPNSVFSIERPTADEAMAMLQSHTACQVRLPPCPRSSRQPREQRKSGKPTEFVQHHKDGSVWAKGKMLAGQQVGYWEWFRKRSRSKLHSGTFNHGKQVGEWTTYDRNGAVYKVTTCKPRPDTL